MMYKAKDGQIYRIRTAQKKDILNIVRVHNISAQKTYEPFKEQYPDLYKAFSAGSLMKNWDAYFVKCEQDKNNIGIVVEKMFASENETGTQIIGVCKAGLLTPQYKKHMEEAHGKPMSQAEADKYANLQTIYIDPKYQGIGLGRGVMGFFANHFAKKGCEYAITETLGGYKDSPRFFNRVGGAQCIGQYDDDPLMAVANNAKSQGHSIPIKLWVMPDLKKMQLPCFFAQAREKQQTRFQIYTPRKMPPVQRYINSLVFAEER